MVGAVAMLEWALLSACEFRQSGVLVTPCWEGSNTGLCGTGSIPFKMFSSDKPSTKQPLVTSSLSCRLLALGRRRSVIVSL